MNSQVLEFYVKMKDLMSGGLAKLAARSKDTFAKMKNNIAQAQGSSKMFGHSIDELRHKLNRVNDVRFGTVMKREFREASREARRLENQIERMEARGSTRRGMGGGVLAGYLGTAAIGLGALTFGAGSVKAAMDYGATKKSFEVLTGSVATGGQLADNLNTMQQNTILGPEVFKAAQTMMGFGIASGDIEENLKELGDISMGNTERFNGLTLAFSNTAAAGRLMGQDLLQYINAGFNPLSIIAKHWKEFGFTAEQTVGTLKEAMSRGEISAQMVSRAIDMATSKGGKYFDMMNKMATTSFGKMKMLEGQWEALKIKSGEALMPTAEMLMKLASLLMEHTEYIVAAGAAWAAYKIASTASLAASSLAASAALGPLGLIAVAIGAITLAWQMARNAQEEYNNILANNSKKVYAQEKQSMATEVAKLMGTQGIGAEEAVSRVKEMHMSNVMTGLRRSGLKLNEYNRKISGIPVGFIPEDVKSEIARVQQINQNYQDSKRAIDDFSASDIQATGAGAGTGGATIPPGGGGDKTVAAGIAGGGPRVINISFRDMVGTLAIHAAGVEAGLDEMEQKLEEHFLRILNSGVAVQN